MSQELGNISFPYLRHTLQYPCFCLYMCLQCKKLQPAQQPLKKTSSLLKKKKKKQRLSKFRPQTQRKITQNHRGRVKIIYQESNVENLKASGATCYVFVSPSLETCKVQRRYDSSVLTEVNHDDILQLPTRYFSTFFISFP